MHGLACQERVHWHARCLHPRLLLTSPLRAPRSRQTRREAGTQSLESRFLRDRPVAGDGRHHPCRGDTMRRTLLLSLVLPLTLLTAKAAAQTCVGMPSFSSGQMQIAGGGSFADGASSFGGTFGYGSRRPSTGRPASAPPRTTASTGRRSTSASAAGTRSPLQTSRTAELCPVASLSIGSGPNDIVGTGVDMSSRTFAFGAAVGAVAGPQPPGADRAQRELPVRQHPGLAGRRHDLGVGLGELRAADPGHRVHLQLAVQPESEHQHPDGAGGLETPRSGSWER